MHVPRLALTAGEPAGIGPDLCALVAQRPHAAELVAIADPALLAARGTGDPVEPVVATDEPELPGPGRADVVGHLARWREAAAALA